MFIAEEMAFLRAILDVPEDRNTWLIYADWLDDRADPRAEFLRLMVARSLMPADDPARPEAEARLTQLRAELDPNWMMVFDNAPAAGCRSGPRDGNTRCTASWDDMTATDVLDIRLCRYCRAAVVFCHTLEEARQFTSCGQRVALSTRIPAAEIEGDPSFRTPEPPSLRDSDAEFELLLDAPDEEPPAAPSPLEPPRPWWKFW